MTAFFIDEDNPAEAAYRLRDLFSTAKCFYEHEGRVVRVVKWPDGHETVEKVKPVTVVLEAHRLIQPFKITKRGKDVEVTLPRSIAVLYLAMHGEWKLPSLDRKVGVSVRITS